jgi:hypothetical protein
MYRLWLVLCTALVLPVLDTKTQAGAKSIARSAGSAGEAAAVGSWILAASVTRDPGSGCHFAI